MEEMFKPLDLLCLKLSEALGSAKVCIVYIIQSVSDPPTLRPSLLYTCGTNLHVLKRDT